MRTWWQSFRARQTPILSWIFGFIALIAAIGTLAMLVVGIFYGRPRTALPFACWIGLSIIVLIIVGWQWSRAFFVGFAIVVLLGLMLLTAEFGETTWRTQQVNAAASTSGLLAARLADTERIAIGIQLKALGPFSKATSPPSQFSLPDPASTLTADLQSYRNQLPLPRALISTLDSVQQALAMSVGPAPSTATSPVLDVLGPALSLRWRAYFGPATTSVIRLCRVDTTPEPPALAQVCSGQPTSGSLVTPARLAQDVARANAAVAAAAQETSPSAARAAALSAAQTAESAAFANPVQSSSNLPGDLAFGIDALVAGSERAQPGSSWWNSPLNGQSWIVVGLLILFGIRWLLVLNNRNGWGPIELVVSGIGPSSTAAPASKRSPPTGTQNPGADLPQLTADDAERWLSTIRSYVAQNVPEPASAPGSSIVKEVTTLATTSSQGLPPWLGIVLNLAAWALFPPSGYRIELDFRSMANPDDASVVVRIGTRGRSRILDVGVVGPHNSAAHYVPVGAASNGASSRPDQLECVLRDTGYWIAGWILSNCTLVPPWATWTPGSGAGLGLYMGIRSKSRSSGTSADPGPPRETDLPVAALQSPTQAIGHLEEARGRGRESSLILLLLAEEYEFGDDFGNALEIYLQALQLCPRYYVARYRVAVALSLLTSYDLKSWGRSVKRSDSQAIRIVRLLEDLDPGRRRRADDYRVLKESIAEEAAQQVGTDGSPARSDGGVEQRVRGALTNLATHHLKKSVKSANFAAMGFKALRREERRFWLTRMRDPIVVRRNLRSAMPCIANLESSRTPVCDVHQTETGQTVSEKRPAVSTVMSWTYSRNTTAQVFYNLACFHAKCADDRECAVAVLERAVIQPYADQLDSDWMRRDPDLAGLDAEPPDAVSQRFTRVLSILDGVPYPSAVTEPQPGPPPPFEDCLERIVASMERSTHRAQKVTDRMQRTSSSAQRATTALTQAVRVLRRELHRQDPPANSG